MTESVLVTGSSRGIGRAIALRAAADGFDVVVHCRSRRDEAEAVAREVMTAGRHSRVLQFDVTDRAACAATLAADIAANGAYYGVVCNAGVHSDAAFPAMSGEQWDGVLDGNLRSAYLTARAALPLLMASDRGAAIVNVSSGLAYAPLPGFAPYASAKAGLVALTKALAIENAPRIRANAVAPSASLTAFMGGGTGRGGDEADVGWFDVEAHAQSIPMARLCQPADVVGPILFLAGPASGFITGQVLHVNGGKLTP